MDLRRDKGLEDEDVGVMMMMLLLLLLSLDRVRKILLGCAICFRLLDTRLCNYSSGSNYFGNVLCCLVL